MIQQPDVVWGPPEAVHGAAGKILSRHLIGMLGLEQGSVFHLVCGDGYVYRMRIAVADPLHTVLELLDRAPGTADPTRRMTLYIAALKGEQMLYVIQHATELGVSRIVPVQTERTDGRRPFKRHARWQRTAWDSAAVSHRTTAIDVHQGMAWTEALDDAASDTTRLLLWERHPTLRSCRSLLRHGPDTASVFVGPEDGFTAAEVAQAEASGVVPCTLGPRMLRGLTAALAAMTICLYELGQLE